MKKCVLLAVILLLSNKATAQSYEGKACHPEIKNPMLSQLKVGQEIKLNSKILYEFYDVWSSSFLKSTGTMPAITQYCKVNDEANASVDCQEQYAESKHLLSCAYSAYRAQDKDPKTAWCEGASDVGVGETVLATVDLNKPINVWAGYGKSQAVFQANARPKQVRVWLLSAASFLPPVSTAAGGNWDKGFPKVIKSFDLELKDLNNYQPIPINQQLKVQGTGFVAIQVLSVYPGSSSTDTCISEISN